MLDLLDKKNITSSVVVAVVAATIIWICATLVDVDKRTAVMAVQVQKNHEMVSALWEATVTDKINRARYDNFEGKNTPTNNYVSIKEEKETRPESRHRKKAKG